MPYMDSMGLESGGAPNLVEIIALKIYPKVSFVFCASEKVS